MRHLACALMLQCCAHRRCDPVKNIVTKTVSVHNNPFATLVVDPWAEDAEVLSTLPEGGMVSTTPGHVQWHFNSTEDVVVTLTLRNATGAGCQ